MAGYILDSVKSARKSMGDVLETIHLTLSSTAGYVYSAGIDTPVNTGAGTCTLSYVKTITQWMITQCTASATASIAIISSEEMTNDLLTLTGGSGDEYNIWVIGLPHET